MYRRMTVSAAIGLLIFCVGANAGCALARQAALGVAHWIGVDALTSSSSWEQDSPMGDTMVVKTAKQ